MVLHIMQSGRKLADWGEKPKAVAAGGAAAVREEEDEVQAAIAASLADAPPAGVTLLLARCSIYTGTLSVGWHGG